ncbi:TRAP transporter permease [Psychrobacter lutiphocae]|uniref:TRAP transporter permease n=1 Tax=Psychrobacter lutiphocae TaxID=540500 RepID=UPI00037DDA83|nr:TRAP transporter permease [Psychrobacter lutiphocae]
MTNKTNVKDNNSPPDPDFIPEMGNVDSADVLEGKRVLPVNSFGYKLIGLIAFFWSFFQLYVVLLPVNDVFVRSIHLAFALVLTFFMYPMFRTKRTMSSIPLWNYALAIVAAVTSLYIFIFYDALNARSGAWLPIDVWAAIVGIILLLMASRRALGPALAIIAIIFLGYVKFGQLMPDMISHQGASINKMMGQMFLTTEGIFGVPLGVSASYVFLFVLFGALLERAGAGKYFIDLAYAALGRYDGGPAKASVAASGMMGIISGSSIANTVTTGTFTIPLMKRLGFPGHKAASVEVAASTNGQLMPPIMGAAAFIIAEFLGMDYAGVIMAAAIPAFVSYIALFYIVHLEAKKLGIKGEAKDRLPKVWSVFVSGLHFLLPVFYLMYTLVVLRMSPQRAAFNGIMVLMAIMIVQPFIKSLYAKQGLNPIHNVQTAISDIGAGMINGAKNMVPIAVATGVAGIVVGSVTITGIGLILADVIEVLSGGYIFAVLALTAVVSLVLGMGLPTTANYIVMASLTAPVILGLSGDLGYLVPAIAAHLFVFYFGILADDTPPVGMAAYAAAGIAKSDPIKTGLQGFAYDIRTAILPFMFFFNSKLLLIEGVDPSNPKDPSGWQWISNPLEIVLIFATAVLGMLAFSSATQRWIRVKTNWLEVVLLIIVTVFLMVPNLVQGWLHLPHEYVSYAIGISLYAVIYWWQIQRQNKQSLGNKLAA